MAENVNINVTENIDQVNVVASEVVEVVDLNLYATTEDVTINVTEEIIQVNVNKITASDITKTSDLINDGEDGVNPFITLQDIPPVEGFVPYTGATQNVDLGEFELKAGQLTLDTSPTGTAAVATTRWNNTLGITETTLKGGSVILKNGIDLVARVVNKVTPNTTLTKANYAAVRISGAQGQRLAVAYAQANNDLNSADTIGLVCETIPTNQEGFILTVGQLENINTTGSLQGETWNDGDVIYLSPTVAGKLTNIKPTAPQHIVIIGYVEYAHANNGKLYVKIMNGWELEELHNVSSTNYTTPIDTDSVLTYDVTNSLWKRLSWSNIKLNLKTYFDTIYQAALGFTPENVANKSTNTSLGTSDTLYPTQNAVKVYADSKVTDAIVDGVTTVAPSQNAVFDALALKQNTLTNPITGTGASGQVAFFNGTTTQTGDNGLFWNNTNKRLGVGTTAPTERLDVNGAIQIRGTRVNNSGEGGFMDYSAGRFRLVSQGQTNTTAGEFLFTVRELDLGGSVDALYIGNTGNVGIGTTSPQARLDVRAQGALSTDIAFRVRNSADTADLMSVNGLGTTTIGNTTGGNIALNVRGNIVANSNSSANITLGTNSSNISVISGYGNGLNIVTVHEFAAGNARILLQPLVNNNIVNTVTGTGVLLYNTGGSERMRITSGGNLLIGTTTDAGYKLDVNGTFRSTVLWTTSGGNTQWGYSGTAYGGMTWDTGYATIYGVSGNDLRFGAGGSSSKMILKTTGNVGIGTTSPAASAQLQVDSTTRGFLPPRMTTTERNAIATPAAGLIVYDTTDNKHYGYNGTTWNAFY